jgi:hypothetical protein
MKIDRFSFNNVVLRDEGEFLCLTDMWRAAKDEAKKRPSDWLAFESTQQFREYLETTLPEGSLTRATEGRNGGTWAHWQLGMAYAKYLSPAFHAWCNDVVRKVMQGGVAVGASAEFAAIVVLLRELSDRQTRLENNQAALWQRFGALAEQMPVGGAIAAARHNALVAEIRTLADVEVRVGAWPKRRAALADIRRELGEATEWGGKGKPWNTMPATLEPVARALLRRRMGNATKGKPLPPQLTLLKTEAI